MTHEFLMFLGGHSGEAESESRGHRALSRQGRDERCDGATSGDEVIQRVSLDGRASGATREMRSTHFVFLSHHRPDLLDEFDALRAGELVCVDRGNVNERFVRGPVTRHMMGRAIAVGHFPDGFYWQSKVNGNCQACTIRYAPVSKNPGADCAFGVAYGPRKFFLADLSLMKLFAEPIPEVSLIKLHSLTLAQHHWNLPILHMWLYALPVAGRA
jgi:hypothetical protein